MAAQQIFSEVFGLLVRIAGFWLALYGLWYLYAAISMAAHGEKDPGYTEFGVPAICVGVILMRFAHLIVRFAYPPKEADFPQVKRATPESDDPFAPK